LEFIEDSRQYEILWNSRDKEHKCNRKKRDILALLAEKYCASFTDIKATIKTQRSLFLNYTNTNWIVRRFVHEMVRLPITHISFGREHTERKLLD
jgi:hypothetical protein